LEFIFAWSKFYFRLSIALEAKASNVVYVAIGLSDCTYRWCEVVLSRQLPLNCTDILSILVLSVRILAYSRWEKNILMLF
jgi:hypothetical protein